MIFVSTKSLCIGAQLEAMEMMTVCCTINPPNSTNILMIMNEIKRADDVTFGRLVIAISVLDF